MTKMQVMFYLVFYQLRKVNLGRMNSVISTSLIDSFIQSRAMQQWRDWLPHTGVHHSLHRILKCLHHATHLQTQQNYKSDSTGKMSFSGKKKKQMLLLKIRLQNISYPSSRTTTFAVSPVFPGQKYRTSPLSLIMQHDYNTVFPKLNFQTFTSPTSINMWGCTLISLHITYLYIPAIHTCIPTCCIHITMLHICIQ